MSQDPVAEVRRWVEQVVIGLDLCPFAATPLRAGTVRFVSSRARDPHEVLAEVLLEAQGLIQGNAGTTTLLVLGEQVPDFGDFLDLVAATEDLLVAAGLSEDIQLAHFHPDYVFEGVSPVDPANGTNRAPWPTLHLLRVADVTVATQSHPAVADIPARNIALLRRLARTDQVPR